MTHIFIVNEKTFNVHLKYMFAGTGSDEKIDKKSTGNGDVSVFLKEPDYKNDNRKESSKEQKLVSMIADISKVKEGDKIIFYVTTTKKFYGVFKAISTAFYDDFDNGKNSLIKELGKNLSFRVCIKPDEVYADGITELEALDQIKDIQRPYQMCWSLIYRKLSGERGCSFITEFESATMIKKIRNKNNFKRIEGSDFRFENGQIVKADSTEKYSINKSSLSIEKRLYSKNKPNKYEVHIQAYIIQNLYKEKISKLLFNNADSKLWIGNEVICSVSEQRMDILTIEETNEDINIRIIELKCQTPSSDIIEHQLPWYIDWVTQYIAPNYDKNVNIIPTIIASKFKRTSNKKENFIEKMDKFNSYLPKSVDGIVIKKLEFISFNLDMKKGDIDFKKEKSEL